RAADDGQAAWREDRARLGLRGRLRSGAGEEQHVQGAVAAGLGPVADVSGGGQGGVVHAGGGPGEDPEGPTAPAGRSGAAGGMSAGSGTGCAMRFFASL